jgi:glutathione S-transferase
VNFAEREQFGAAFLAINSKSKVPALQRDDGSVLTEFQAISIYLALTHPEKRLIPSDPEGFARMMEAMDYCVGTIHAVGFRRLFRPGEFAARESDYSAVEARGREIVKAGFTLLDKALADKDWVVGDFSLADPALSYPSYWAEARLNIELPNNLRRHYERMMERPSVRRALRDEGL